MSKEGNLNQFKFVEKLLGQYRDKVENKDVDLKMTYEEMTGVKVYTPEELQGLAEGYAVHEHITPAKDNCNIRVVNMDSFEAALSYKGENTMVLNFASPVKPGGGVENGAGAQEESLCRTSTLYASISSEEASVMYNANQAAKASKKEETDYCLLSPCVSVFSNRKFDLLPEAFRVGVITMPAVNVSGSFFKKLIQKENEKVKEIMKRRIRYILSIAADNQYDTLILGAWGCGVFGNNPIDVAGYFYDVLYSEGMVKYFSNIVFAIYTKDVRNDENYLAFSKCYEKKYAHFFAPDDLYGYMSNWYKSNFEYEGIAFTSVEQYMAYRKAGYFNDYESQKKIMELVEPKDIFEVSRKVEGFDEHAWKGVRQIFLYEGLLCKFGQNEELKNLLLETKDAIIVKCDRADSIWSIGIGIDDEKKCNRTKWVGRNLSGYTLMQVREKMKKTLA